jgi:hypothetical protein
MSQAPSMTVAFIPDLLEQLRAESGERWGTSSKLYRRVDKLLRELADPNLHDIPANLPIPGGAVGQSPPPYSMADRHILAAVKSGKQALESGPLDRQPLAAAVCCERPPQEIVLRNHAPPSLSRVVAEGLSTH